MKSMSINDLVPKELLAKRRPSLADEAAEKLRDLILLEKLPPGLSLNERELSEILGISRTPVREAIRQLEFDGLVEYGATRRPSVADPSMEVLSQWLMIQGALEGLAGEQACFLATDKELEHIKKLQDQMIELTYTDDRLRLFGIDMEFHRAIVAAARNPSLVEIHNCYNARLWRARFVSSQRRSNREVQTRKHQDIVDSLLARDCDAASTALVTHLRNAIGNIKAAKTEQASDQIPAGANA
ncbi:MAG: GntR family transcriptional regulator [Albidovulum sp.]|nr:GntR family transcriptional regulator [Albidovulum sp.]